MAQTLTLPQPTLFRRDKFTENAVTPSTLFNVYSCTKALTALALHRCVEMGLLNYGDYIHEHWPGFRAQCTVEQVNLHNTRYLGLKMRL